MEIFECSLKGLCLQRPKNFKNWRETLSPTQFRGGINIQMSYLKRSYCLPKCWGATLVSVISRGQEQKALCRDTYNFMIWIPKIPDKFLSCTETTMFFSQHWLQSPRRKDVTKTCHTIISCCERRGTCLSTLNTVFVPLSARTGRDWTTGSFF